MTGRPSIGPDFEGLVQAVPVEPGMELGPQNLIKRQPNVQAFAGKINEDKRSASKEMGGRKFLHVTWAWTIIVLPVEITATTTIRHLIT